MVTKTEEWEEAIKKHLERLSREEKYEFVHQLIFDFCCWIGATAYEQLGILEGVKYTLLQTLEEDFDEDMQ
jgi:hypothetical protein